LKAGGRRKGNNFSSSGIKVPKEGKLQRGFRMNEQLSDDVQGGRGKEIAQIPNPAPVRIQPPT